MINYEFFIQGYRADVATDLPSMLTFAIDDVSDFAARSTTFSKTIVLPGTARNNDLLGNIFQFQTENTTDDGLPNVHYNFNAFLSADVLIFQNNIQCLKGTMRLLKIINIKGQFEYEVAVFGELSLFISNTSAHLLEELDFSAYNVIWNATHIAASWDNQGADVYFPLIDYGTYSTLKHDWDFRTFRPALFVKEYIDKIFSSNGFTYVSDLFETARFESLIIPYSKKILTKKSTNILNRTSPTTVHDGDVDPIDDMIFSGDVLTFDFTTADDITFEYTGAGFTGDITVRFVGEYTGGTGSVTFTLYFNGSPVATTTANGTFDKTITYPASLVNTNTISVGYSMLPHRMLTVHANLTVGSAVPIDVPAELGDLLIINDCLPKNIRQIDFIAGLIKLFNLYIWEDKFDERKLYIEPYIDFYDLDPVNAIDWSYKINRDKAIKITPLSELTSRYYNFKFKDDSDYYNDLYKKRYNETYGSRIYDSAYQFGSDKKDIEVLFSGTPLVGYSGEDKVYSTIFKMNNNIEENIDSNIRILQTLKVVGVSSWLLKDAASTLQTYTDYGYAGHVNDPDAPTDDLNFGALKELFFILVSGNLSANQFNVYWSAYMAEITSQHSKLLSAMFRLSAMDIFNLDFSKLLWLDGSLWRLNKIQDYNATKEDECSVELLKVINLQY